VDTLAQLATIVLALFVILLGSVVYRLHKTKRKLNLVDYSTVAIFCIFIMGSLFWVFEQFIWGLFTIFGALILLMVLIPFSRENAKADATEAMKNVDLSEPIRLRDFFSWKFIPKLERKYGERKTLAIYVITFLCLGGASVYLAFFLIENLILINDPWYRGMPWSSMVGAIIGSLLGSLIGYRDAKRALKNLKNTQPHPQIDNKQGN